MNKEEDILYNKTQKFGRTQFVRELARLQQENKELKERIDKAIINIRRNEQKELILKTLKGENNENN